MVCWCVFVNIRKHQFWPYSQIIINNTSKPNEPVHEIMVLITQATSKGSSEPGHPRSLARAFAVRTHEVWEYSKGPTKNQTSSHWMAAHARLKNEFTEDEKYHNLMRWLKWRFILISICRFRTDGPTNLFKILNSYKLMRKYDVYSNLYRQKESGLVYLQKMLILKPKFGI